MMIRNLTNQKKQVPVYFFPFIHPHFVKRQAERFDQKLFETIEKTT